MTLSCSLWCRELMSYRVMGLECDERAGDLLLLVQIMQSTAQQGSSSLWKTSGLVSLLKFTGIWSEGRTAGSFSISPRSWAGDPRDLIPFAGILPQSQHFQRNCCIFRINRECFCCANPLPTMGLVKPSNPASHSRLFLPCWLLQVYNPGKSIPSHPTPFGKSCFSILLLLVASSVSTLCSHPFAEGALWEFCGAGSWALSAALFFLVL